MLSQMAGFPSFSWLNVCVWGCVCVCKMYYIYDALYIYMYIYDVLYREKCYIYVERDIDGEDGFGGYHALYISYEPHSTLLPFLLK